MNIDNLFPLIVPRDYIDSGLSLPHQTFPNVDFVLSWAEFEGESMMTYLTETRYRELDDSSNNWQQRTFENLRNSGSYFHTQAKLRDGTDHLIFLSFLNEDGIGSSRILLDSELGRGFPQGYYLAFPDRSCGMVISKDITEAELEEIRLLIKRMFENATTPMSGEMFSPKEFALPMDWTAPIDEEFSTRIVDAIRKMD